ncbi:flagellar hook-associated protein FlgK [Oerskovia paurometabola]|uniref:Flagellar hook-associated protein 1 n=1 Tax=Oerskovia paurometabola TaxID=162170 RepID=A0ABW1X6R1_9CELL|nr:flagellar hook-associated protein FlgK [Oerskovia paurometabola]MBM7496266.1 flagellar hook-associated protein 1 FlgK [Oerskovia paurometabola]
MSSFAILNTARQGLNAAQAGIDVTGQNVANLNTNGYTRQRIQQSSVSPLAEMGLARFAQPVRNGQGVSIDGVARLGNLFLESRVRQTASNEGYSVVRATAFNAVEDIHGEPSDTGMSATLQSFWSGWQDVANAPGKEAQARVVIERAVGIVDRLVAGRAEVAGQWQQSRTSATSLVSEVNAMADKVAALNAQIRDAAGQGVSTNELVDHRNQVTASLAQVAGAQASMNPDGTVSVLLGGNLLVDGTTTNPVKLAGSQSMDGATTDPVRLEWAHRAGAQVALEGGDLAGHLSALAPASSGGVYAQAAAGYDALASTIAAQVNALHTTAQTTTGAPGGPFFVFDAGKPPASGIKVAVTDPSQVAAGGGGGALDGSVADKIARLGVASDGPDAGWSAHVATIAVKSSSATYDAKLATIASTAAFSDLLSNSAVSLDEETVNLVQYQHAYQGAARVLTAVDEMLDQLINRTGRVGL